MGGSGLQLPGWASSRSLRLIAATIGLTIGVAAIPQQAGAATQVGFKAHSYSGFNAESVGGAITGQKPESKLWFLDGSWWAAMLSPTASGAHHIYRLVADTWIDSGTLIDPRPSTKEDVLLVGSTLYVVSRSGDTTSSKLRRFTYAAGIYTLDSGYPVDIPGTGAETTTIARDTQGSLWLTFEENNNIQVAHASESSPGTWKQYIIPTNGAKGVNSDDISGIISFTDASGPAIGVMWSNQNTMTDYFAVHRDGAGDTDIDWILETALTGDHEADDHVNCKTFSGKIFCVTKTSKNDINATGQPIIRLLVRSTTGSWSKYPVVNVGERVTSRPITILDIDPAARQVYVFMTIGEGSSASGIAYKKTSLDNPSFPTPWTIFIQGPSAEKISDATSTKQNANGGGSAGIVVLASDTQSYWWNRIAPPPPPPAPDFTLSASPTSQTVAAGGTTGPYTITVNHTNGHSAAVTLSASGLPSGATASFSTNPTTTTSNMTIATTAATPPGSYPITVQGTDGTLTRTTSVTMVVTGGNTAPTAANKIATTSAGTPVTITLSGTDAETCDLIFSTVTTPTGGTVGGITNKPCVPGTPNSDTVEITYSPNPGFTGSDSFSYRTNDGNLSSPNATVTITVTSSGTGGAIALGPPLTTGADGTDRAANSAYTTASFAPQNGNVVVAFVFFRSQGADISGATVTLSGGGVTTWAPVASRVFTSGNVRKIWMFRAQQSAYGASAPVRISFSSAALGAAWSFSQYSGVIDDTAHNGAGAIVQSKTNFGSGATSGSVALAAPAAAANRPVAGFAHGTGEAATPRTSWTEIGDSSFADPSGSGLETQWRSDSFETTASASWSTSSSWGVIAAELKAR